MNWKLIAGLSLAGVLMGFATVYGLSSKMEAFAWLPFFLLSAWLIARYAEKRAFLHGFLAGLANCLWSTLIHVKLSAKYLAAHPIEAKQFAKLQAQSGGTIVQAMVTANVVAGIMAAVVLGLFAGMASGFLKKMA